jgi:diacylglycerol O-acyltransferase / wax synthase
VTGNDLFHNTMKSGVGVIFHREEVVAFIKHVQASLRFEQKPFAWQINATKERNALHFWASSDSIVRRLSGLDSGFLSLETSKQPMQNIALALLRAHAGNPLTLDILHRHLSVRLHQLPAFRWRVVAVPLGLAHSVFVDDACFDLAEHLDYAVLPEPGGPQELDAACAELASRRLDRRRPLWQLTLIDGLADGRQGLVLEVHHALMDGVAVVTTLARIFSPEEPGTPPEPRVARREPGRGQLAASALAHNVHALARLPKLIRRTRRAAAAVRQRQAATAVKAPKARVDPPPSAINLGFTCNRRYARAALPLDDVFAVARAAKVTVNDVALAVVSGALREYLQLRGPLPDRPLVANVPVGTKESAVTPRTQANHFSRLTTSLATNIVNPWDRLQTISTITAEAKACLALAGGELLADWLEYLPPIIAVPMVRRNEAARRRLDKQSASLDSNVVVSNLRGPSIPWRLGSTIVEEMYLVGPPNSGIGVNFALWDYAGRLLFGILAFADSVENPRELAMGLSRSLDELIAAAQSHHISTA